MLLSQAASSPTLSAVSKLTPRLQVPAKTKKLLFASASVPQIKTPAWIDKGIRTAQYMDNKLVPRLLYPFAKLLNPAVTVDYLAQCLRTQPYSMTNSFYRLKYPRTLGIHVYGSARPSPTNDLKDLYALGEQTGRALAKAGLFPVTGGGPGVMESVAKGAKEAGGHTVGVALPSLGEINAAAMGGKLKEAASPYQELVYAPTFTHRLKGPGGFFHRAGRVLILPGGLGTIREMLEALEEVAYVPNISHFAQQRQIVILDHNGFYAKSLKPCIDQLIESKVVSPSIYKMLKLVPTIDEAIKTLNDSSVPWTDGLKGHRHRNLKYKSFSLSSMAEKLFHKVHWDRINSKTAGPAA